MLHARRIGWIFTGVHAALILASVLAFALIVDHPPPAWADPGQWAVSYRIGMQWTGSAYIVTGFVAALAGWIAVAGVRRGLLSAGVVVALALGAELLGVATGIPFGSYGYGTTLGPRVLGLVPAVIPLSWFLMLYASLAVAARLGRGAAATLVAAGVGLVAWDVLMEPAMSAAFPFWSWHQGGTYYGMPLINWAGWLLTGTGLAAALLAVSGRRAIQALETERLPVVLYALNGLFPFALAVESGMYAAALVGAAAMAAFALSPALRGVRLPAAARSPSPAGRP